MPGTLAKVAAIGFKEVEFAGLFDRSPKDVRAMLDQNGLTAPGTHVDWVTVDKKLPETLETARVMGHQFVIVPYLSDADRKQPDIYKRLADVLNRAGVESAKSGIQMAYHQHGFEFVPADGLGGKLPYDFLLENTDPKLVKMELDLCWIAAAEKDPLAYFNRYPGRFPLVHVKDWLKDGKPGEALRRSARTGHQVHRRDGERRTGVNRLEADLRAGRQGRGQALHRRARQPEGSARRSRRQLQVRAESAILS